MNDNCLAGMCCPECSQEDEFEIAVKAWASVSDEGTEDIRDVEWDNDSVCRCPECGFTGKVGDFMMPEPDNAP